MAEPLISPLHGPDIATLLTVHPRPWRAEVSEDDAAYVILVDGAGRAFRAEPAAYGRLIVAAVNALRPDTPAPQGVPS